MWSVSGRTALVTGGGKGIGRAVALALSARGVNVVVTGREERALGETVGEIAHGGGKARHLAGDVRDGAHVAAAVGRAVEVFGGLDIVIANAALTGPAELDGDRSMAEAILQTNLLGTYATFDAALLRMKGPGRLIAVRRLVGERVVGGADGEPDGEGAADARGHAAEASSHAGVIGLVLALARDRDLAARKITCNAVVGSRDLAPEDVAEMVLFLCTRAADGLTGRVL